MKKHTTRYWKRLFWMNLAVIFTAIIAPFFDLFENVYIHWSIWLYLGLLSLVSFLNSGWMLSIYQSRHKEIYMPKLPEDGS